MKLNKSSILALMTLGGLMAFGRLASADDSTTKPVPPPDAPSAPDTTTPPSGARRGNARNMEKILDQLNLNDEQKEKIKPLLKDQAEKMRAMNQDSSLSTEDKRSKRKEIRDETNTKLKAIMTADQFTQWEKLSAQARGGRRRNASTPPADSSTTTPPAPNDNK